MRLVKDFFIRQMDQDEAVCERLVEWYRHRPSLKGIEVLVIDGVAILHGRITNSTDRALAIDLALDAGAMDVLDELTLHRPVASRQAASGQVKQAEPLSCDSNDPGGGRHEHVRNKRRGKPT